MIVLGIDPGPERSGWALYGLDAIESGETVNGVDRRCSVRPDAIACEWIESYGMAVGADVFHTCRWIGRYEQIAAESGVPFHLVPRRAVKLHLCGSARATDANVRQALIDRYGGKAKAIGKKKAPGPLYSVKGHAWAALACAVVYSDTHEGQP